MNSDEVLMLEFQGGSRSAFEELYSRYSGPIYGFFRRRLATPQRAEDLTQETFLAVIRGASRYQPRALVRTYLYGIAMKLLFTDRRKQSHEGPQPETSPEPSTGSTQETGMWVRQAVARLDASERENPDAAGIRATKLRRDCRPAATPDQYRTLAALSSGNSAEGAARSKGISPTAGAGRQWQHNRPGCGRRGLK